MTTDAERLRAMAACMGEVVETLPAGALRTVAEALLKEYRESRVKAVMSRTGQDVLMIDDEEDEGRPDCGCSKSEPCDRHNPWSGLDQGGDVDTVARDIRDAGRGR